MMDVVVVELLRYGWSGVVIVVVMLGLNAIGPILARAAPAWASSHRRREDQLLEALRAATACMTEIAIELRSVRGDVAAVRRDQVELRSDMEHIAERLQLPRPRQRKEKKMEEGGTRGS